ncbi:MAG: hypothetical protein ABL952_14965 [Pyrinomonadaceae bacterium]
MLVYRLKFKLTNGWTKPPSKWAIGAMDAKFCCSVTNTFVPRDRIEVAPSWSFMVGVRCVL